MTKKITIRMPKADLGQWLAALRAPENQNRQGVGQLFNEESGGYCCLGVAQCVKTAGKVECTADGNWGILPSLSWLESVGWEFLDAESGIYDNPYLPSLDVYAGEANDCGRYSFAEIASAIEDCAEGY